MKMNFTTTIEKSRAVRTYTRCTMVIINKHHRLAKKDELEKIGVSEAVALEKISCISKGQAFPINKWVAFMCAAKETLDGIQYYYEGYKIDFNRKLREHTIRLKTK